MLPTSLLVPPAFFAVSSFVFSIAFQLPHRGRLYLAPLLFGSALLSLHTSSYLASLTGLNVLWGLLSCIWILHSAAVLYFDRQGPPPGAPPWASAYKAWNDPQRRINWATAFAPGKEASSSPKTRAGFVIQRLSKVVICWLLQLFIIGLAVPLYFNFTAQYFAPSRQVFIRRLLSPRIGPPVTHRELQIRFFMSVYWIWIAYLILDFFHVLLSIFFVAVLRIDAPEEWPPLFGSPGQAYSIRRFWTRFWHRLTVPSCASSGQLVTRRLAGMTPGSRPERVFITFWTFCLSGVCHAAADWQAGELSRPMDDIVFFLANFAAGVVESLIVTRVDRTWKRHGRGRVHQLLWSDAVRKTIGFAWVLGFFFWIAPKWQYPKLYDTLLHFGIQSR